MSNTIVLKANKVNIVVSLNVSQRDKSWLEFACNLLMFRVTCVKKILKNTSSWHVLEQKFYPAAMCWMPCGSWKLTLFIKVYNVDDTIAHLSRRPCATQICWKHIKQQTVSLLVEYLLYSVALVRWMINRQENTKQQQ